MRFEYRREIDGLRALAILPVVFFHAGIDYWRGGFVGVDIFFVISGYLITSLIYTQHQTNQFSLVEFYERRARRILPAMFLVMFSCLPFAWLWLSPADLKNFSISLVNVSGFVSNFFFYRQSGYFDTSTELKPLLHTWSLAIEEQYYLFFPLLIAVMWRFGKRSIVFLIGALALCSLVVAELGVLSKPAATFYLLPSRAWELLIGALAGLYLADQRRVECTPLLANVASVIGLLLIVFAIFAFDQQTPFPGLHALFPTMGAVLLILFARPATVVGGLLCARPVVAIGLISYSAYLWHQPLFAFARHRSVYAPSAGLMLALVALSLVLAVLSWKFVETPFRDKNCFSRKQIFSYSALGMAVFISIGLIGSANNGFPERIPAAVSDIPEMELPRVDNGWCFYAVDGISELPIGQAGLGCALGDPLARQSGALFGDSFAGQYEPFWDQLGKKIGLNVRSLTTNWCFPSLDKSFTGPISSRAFDQCMFNRQYLLDNLSRYDFVILAGDWGDVLKQNKLSGMLDLVAHLSRHVPLVVIMASPKQFDGNVGEIYKKTLYYGSSFDIEKISRSTDELALLANAKLAEMSHQHTNIVFVDRDAMFHLGGIPSDLTLENKPYSLEGQHLSVYGSKAAATAFMMSDKFPDFRRRFNR